MKANYILAQPNKLLLYNNSLLNKNKISVKMSSLILIRWKRYVVSTLKGVLINREKPFKFKLEWKILLNLKITSDRE